jgi:hypothetical protein
LLHANDHPQVQAMIDGKGPYRFYVETGAREIDVSHALAQILGLQRTAGTESDPEYHVDRITVGSATFDDMTVAELPPGVQGIDGVLGLPFFQSVLLTIDYPAGRLDLSRGSLDAAKAPDVLHLVRIDDFWGVPIDLAGQHFDAVLDTQNSGQLALPPVIAAQLPFDGGLQVIGHARGVFGVVDVQGGTLAGNLTIGPYRFPTPFIDVIQLPPDFPRQPNIGSGLLSHFVVTLDQRHGLLRLEHAGSPDIELPRPVRRPATSGSHG